MYQTFSAADGSSNNRSTDVPVILDRTKTLANIGHIQSLFRKVILGNISKSPGIEEEGDELYTERV
jgi:hypothetical protein